MTNKKDMERKNGPMAHAMRETILKEGNMAMESLYGVMALLMMESGQKTRCMERDYLTG